MFLANNLVQTLYNKLPLNRARCNEMAAYIEVGLSPIELVLHRYCSLYNKIRLFRKKIQVPWTSMKRELTVEWISELFSKPLFSNKNL